MDRMGTTCSSHHRNHQRNWGPPTPRKRKGSDGSYGSCSTDSSCTGVLRSSLRHSVVSAIPDVSISDLYPVEDNYVNESNGKRSPKSLSALATDALCRSLPLLNGELPPGLPQDVVDDIVHSLIKHSAVNATTLRALRNCELPILSLANCRGVTDSWLEPLGNKTHEATPEFQPVATNLDTVENMDLDAVPQHEASYGFLDCQRSADGSCSTASFVSASSNLHSPTQTPMCDTQMTHIDDHPVDEDHHMSDLSPRQAEMHEADCLEDTKRSPSYLTSAPTFVTTHVTLLDLRGSQRLTDRGLLHLADLGCLEIARLDNCHSIQGRGLLAFASSHRLHTLSMANCRRLTDEAVVNISHLLSLQALSLHGCRCLTDRSLAALADLYNLTKLDVSQCDLITDEGIDMLESLENLNELSLGWCRQLTDRALELLTKQPQRPENIRILRLARCNITDDGIADVSRLLALEELDLNGCARITSAALGRVVERLEHLTRLDVSYCPGILRSSWQGKIDNLKSLELCYSAVRDTHIFRLRLLPALEELYLDSCPISDSAIGHLADNHVVPNLTSLDLADTDLTDLGMSHIAKFPKLTRLSLFYCNISNSGLRHISKLTQLETLNLDSRDISDDGLRHLRQLQNLKSLDIFSGRITDTGCGHISKISSLEALELCGGGVGDLGCTLLATLENLTNLNLSQNDRISNRGAAALAALSNLQSLNLSNTRVNASALRFFSALRKLQNLAMYGCNGVESGASLNNLQNGLPNLKCVRVHTTEEEEGMVVRTTNNSARSNIEQEDAVPAPAEMWMHRDDPEDMQEDNDEEAYSDHD